METKNDAIIIKDDFQKKKIKATINEHFTFDKNIYFALFFVVSYRIFHIKAKRGLFHINEWHEQISYSNVSYKV